MAWCYCRAECIARQVEDPGFEPEVQIGIIEQLARPDVDIGVQVHTTKVGAYCGRIGVEPDPPPAERCIVPVAGQFERGHAAHVHWYFQQARKSTRLKSSH